MYCGQTVESGPSEELITSHITLHLCVNPRDPGFR